MTRDCFSNGDGWEKGWEKAFGNTVAGMSKEQHFFDYITFYIVGCVTTIVLFQIPKKQNQPEYGGAPKWNMNSNKSTNGIINNYITEWGRKELTNYGKSISIGYCKDKDKKNYKQIYSIKYQDSQQF